MNKEVLSRWSTAKSDEIYGVSNWGKGYYSVDDNGLINVVPYNKKDVKVPLIDIVKKASDRGLEMPLLVRFENLLDARIARLNDNFKKAMKNLGYKGSYEGVYPVKVNQQQEVVKEIASFGKKYHHGFEVGSKPELIAVMAEMLDKKANIICNGYKDKEFIDLGLYYKKLGYNLFFVVEMPGEASLILERGEKLGIEPNIGIRIKLSEKAGGHWMASGGDRSIFGLNMSQVIETVDLLKSKKKLSTLKLLHYHLGSQIPNIRDIRFAVVEATRVYAELVKEGAPMGYLDLGGGLAVDYDGSNTNFASSRNYNTFEYCADVVEAVMSVLDKEEVQHPVIVTESGRSLVAFYSILLFNVLDVAYFSAKDVPKKIEEDVNEEIKNLFYVSKDLNVKNLTESYNDALFYRDSIKNMFNQGRISLRERSMAEKIFWNLLNKINTEIKKLKFVPRDLEELELAIADIYYCNFSLFQSLPDSWAIDQLFPIVPIHRLDEMPTRNAILADITCDCDGEISKFIDVHDIKKTLQLHEVKDDEDYIIGVFLVGAYQETLGDLHNLFGDTNVITVKIDKEGEFEIIYEMEGDSVEDVLSYVEYDTKKMRRQFRKKTEDAIRTGIINAEERKNIMDSFEMGLRGYTYYEQE